MKRYVPLKYILGMIVLFFIIPSTLIYVLIYFVGLNKLTISICILLVFFVIFSPVVYYKNQENASIVVTHNKIINYMNDGTMNFGWEEEIKNIKKIEVVNNAEVKKYYKNCKAKKALLIDFGSYNVKYISVSLFTTKQIEKIIEHIEYRRVMKI